MKDLQKKVKEDKRGFLEKAKQWHPTWPVDTVERQIILRIIAGGKDEGV